MATLQVSETLLFYVRDMVKFAGSGRAPLFSAHNLAHCLKDWKPQIYAASLLDAKNKNMIGDDQRHVICFTGYHACYLEDIVYLPCLLLNRVI